jgi:hypothetical protein
MIGVPVMGSVLYLTDGAKSAFAKAKYARGSVTEVAANSLFPNTNSWPASIVSLRSGMTLNRDGEMLQE